MMQLTQGWKFMAKLCRDCSAGSPGKLRYIWKEGVQDGEMQQNVQCVPEKKIYVLYLCLSQTSFSDQENRKRISTIAREIPQY